MNYQNVELQEPINQASPNLGPQPQSTSYRIISGRNVALSDLSLEDLSRVYDAIHVGVKAMSAEMCRPKHQIGESANFLDGYITAIDRWVSEIEAEMRSRPSENYDDALIKFNVFGGYVDGEEHLECVLELLRHTS
ncbi:MAG: hypothetical protein GXP04_12255 [Alphaproteobacteria bacterium]|nr:hypothetical protein [Alphaproteobacteria bacterium]